jgi:hypothetical protein
VLIAKGGTYTPLSTASILVAALILRNAVLIAWTPASRVQRR